MAQVCRLRCSTRGHVVRQVGIGCDEDAGQRQREQQQRDARAQRHARAAGLCQPEPADQHQQRPGELQRVAAAPEQDFVVRLAGQRRGHHRQRPAEGQQRHRGRHHAALRPKRSAPAPSEARPTRGARGHSARSTSSATPSSEGHQASLEQRPFEHRDVVGHDRRARRRRTRASDISSVPPAAQPERDPAPALSRAACAFRLHSTPAMATNHTSTDRSTCTTSATRKKSATGSHWLTPGVRASTSSIENRPEPISASSPSHNQPRANARCAASGTGKL